ncbi:hypothetical protein [Deferrisoma camini]|uniref:hypothetical protein n=1 Tax=Deferrisoma camini TaxID=1035120 RepID=UPI0004B19626|nr:hypothetical protein [Deferrisoma camini]
MRRLMLLFCTVLAVVWAGPAPGAEVWKGVSQALDAWQGEKTAVIRGTGADPLAVPEVRELLRLFTQRGFVVVPAAPAGQGPDRGLVLDLRREGDSWVAALRRASDGAFLAVDEAGLSGPATEPPPPPSPRTAAPQAVPEAPARRARTIELQETPRRLVAVGDEIVLLYDDRVVRATLTDDGVRELARFQARTRPSRALWLDVGDLDRDGVPEVAVTWAEDVQQVYEGTDSWPHSWILAWPDLAPQSKDLTGYLRIVGNRAFLQRRGRFSAFEGGVLSVTEQAGQWQPGTAVPWLQGHAIYDATPLSGGRWVSHRTDQRWRLSDAEGRSGPVLLADLGRFRGPAVAVRLENPEFRSGFEKEDRVTERWIPLPRRVVVSPDGGVYTIRRGRTPGLPLVGRPSGSDAVVRIRLGADAMGVDEPFGAVELFLVDFGLLGHGQDGVLLLGNEREDGRGTAYLQEIRP